jgi:predicted RNA-binding protein YlxR (DUF448 family)
VSRERHRPVRSCTACRRKGGKDEFVRIVRHHGGTVAIDDAGTAEGRGAYLCPDPACLATAIKKRSLARALRLTSEARAVLEPLYESLRSRIGEGGRVNS